MKALTRPQKDKIVRESGYNLFLFDHEDVTYLACGYWVIPAALLQPVLHWWNIPTDYRGRLSTDGGNIRPLDDVVPATVHEYVAPEASWPVTLRQAVIGSLPLEANDGPRRLQVLEEVGGPGMVLVNERYLRLTRAGFPDHDLVIQTKEATSVSPVYVYRKTNMAYLGTIMPVRIG